MMPILDFFSNEDISANTVSTGSAYHIKTIIFWHLIVLVSQPSPMLTTITGFIAQSFSVRYSRYAFIFLFVTVIIAGKAF